MTDAGVLTDRFSPVSLRRHGRRPLKFQGALLVGTPARDPDEAAEPSLRVYETAAGTFVLGLDWPGRRADAFELDDPEAVGELLDGLDPRRWIPSDVSLHLAVAGGADAALAELHSLAGRCAEAYRRSVDALLHGPANAALPSTEV